ncbi:formate--tetrahydrofolate ligase [Campylobacter sp. VBCF_06 NA8]|uniref:formate--tetrahydrofolate ligase n=1 Tax=Campylobacter sp. VBCF_06 NA8 TaxID=2983822 RepID=UPI0022E9B311|nr:formate--tetrahydrofolate ligase [Campylobacter sp. VBCF_06 NA8]MDA3046905.1 formate--tetrahydrofolate ligase [Campylobacter sp. VBCF_06 NA8]
MLSDIEITHNAKLKKITKIGKKLGLKKDEIEPYGFYKAKIPGREYSERHDKNGAQGAKLILVTAISPTPYGEGKTTTSIGLADAIKSLGKSVALALREPSLGPVFGIKGGAAGGGYSQLAPMEELNLHFTGDFHAITSANNLISAIIDNSIYQGNPLKIKTVLWKRCMDMNDRALRQITVGQGGKFDGVERKDGFNITAASEIMAILCLSKNLADLKKNIANIMVAYDEDDKPVFVRDLGCEQAVSVLLKEAIKPNLFQSIEHTPTFVHGGPFANIAHGCNSIIATKTAMSLADFVVTEAGFGSELGAQKFLDIKCPRAGIAPDAVVLVATIRSLKYNGGAAKDEITNPNLEALMVGIENLGGHIEILQNFGLNPIVALNKFSFDSDEEIEFVRNYCTARSVKMALCENFAKGSVGAIDLAKLVLAECKILKNINYTYDKTDDIKTKIEKIATKIYGAKEVVFENLALGALEQIRALGLETYDVCIAKTQYSFSDDEKALGRACGFSLRVKDLQIRTGAKFIVAVAGKIMLMPGLSKHPSALDMKISDDGVISGLS